MAAKAISKPAGAMRALPFGNQTARRHCLTPHGVPSGPSPTHDSLCRMSCRSL
jgi:hypothetical protein